MSKKLAAPIPRLALTIPEAAASIGVGEDFFNAQVRPEVRLIRRGEGKKRKPLVPITELERWVSENADELPVTDQLSGR